MTVFGKDEYELFLIALGVEEQADTDSISMLYLPAFGVPFYASIQLSVPCKVKLHIPMEEWGSEYYLDIFEHYWEAEGELSLGYSKRILKEVYDLNASDFVDYCDPKTRDGFAAYCKGVVKGEAFCFSTQNPNWRDELTHISYLTIIRKALFKLFPNILAIQRMRPD